MNINHLSITAKAYFPITRHHETKKTNGDPIPYKATCDVAKQRNRISISFLGRENPYLIRSNISYPMETEVDANRPESIQCLTFRTVTPRTVRVLEKVNNYSNLSVVLKNTQGKRRHFLLPNANMVGFLVELK